MLEVLKLEYIEWPPDISDVFSIAPRLREVSLANLSPTTIALPWENVKVCELQYISLQKFLQTVAGCTQLQSLTGEDIDEIDDDVDTDLPTKIDSKISSLRLLHCFGTSVHSILEVLNVPDLTTFTAGYLSARQAFPHDTFIEMVSRSGSTLTSLTLKGILITAVDLITVLHALPSLADFSLAEGFTAEPPTCISEMLFTKMNSHFSLSFSSTSHIILPQLRRLSIASSDSENTNIDAAFLRMVKSRSAPGGAATYLQKVELALLRRKFDPACLSLLENLSAAGMCISVSDLAGRVV
jgi:hypothetical protein